METLPHLQPPGDEEARLFYYGMPSIPRLVGRASSGVQLWESVAAQQERQHSEPPGRRPRSTWSGIRTLTPGPLGNHPIRQRYTWKVHADFVLCLEPLRWTSVDFLQMIPTDFLCPVELYTGQTVVWVGLEHGNEPWEVVASVLRACRRVLDKALLFDVDVQFRVSQLIPLTGKHVDHAATPRPGSSRSRNVLLNPLKLGMAPYFFPANNPFRTTLGQSIFPAKRITIRGSFGLYLWPANKNIKVAFGLTCRHVGMITQDNDEYSIVPIARRGELDKHRRENPDAYRIGIADKDLADSYMDDLVEGRNQLAAQVQNSEADTEDEQVDLGRIQRLLDAVEPFRDAKARELGTVIYSPPIGRVQNSATPSSWTRDICVFQLEDSMLPHGKGTNVSMDTQWPANIVDLRSYTEGDLTAKLNSFATAKYLPPNAPSAIKFKYPKNGLLHLKGTVPIGQLLCSRGPTANFDDTPCTVVGKCGAQTGLTWGWTSEMLSFTRRYQEQGIEHFDSFEVAVYGMGKMGGTDPKLVPFSEGGDSGSAVFGVDGRLAGFMTGGTRNGRDESSDVTYMTPANFVLDDIQKALGMKLKFCETD